MAPLRMYESVWLHFPLACRERYLGTLLQVEKMLKIWFPHIPLKESQASYSVSAREACGAAKVSAKITVFCLTWLDSVHNPLTLLYIYKHLTCGVVGHAWLSLG